MKKSKRRAVKDSQLVVFLFAEVFALGDQVQLSPCGKPRISYVDVFDAAAAAVGRGFGGV